MFESFELSNCSFQVKSQRNSTRKTLDLLFRRSKSIPLYHSMVECGEYFPIGSVNFATTHKYKRSVKRHLKNIHKDFATEPTLLISKSEYDDELDSKTAECFPNDNAEHVALVLKKLDTSSKKLSLFRR